MIRYVTEGRGVKTKMLRLVTKGGRGSKMAVIGVT